MTDLDTEILADTAAAAAVGRHVDEVEDDGVVLPAADCTLPTKFVKSSTGSTSA